MAHFHHSLAAGWRRMRWHFAVAAFFPVIMSAFPSLLSAQCNLIITDPPAVCGVESVDITAASVTQGSTSGMLLSYWKDASATLALTNPNKVGASGTYYIKGVISGGCMVIKPVTVNIQAPPGAVISYPGSPFCALGPAAYVALTGTTGGTFSASPPGLTINTSTGTVVLETSKAGNYIVTYTIAPSGACPASLATTNLIINPLVVPTIAAIGPLCQDYPPPVLPTTSPEGITGTWNPAAISTAAAGTFTYMFTPDAGQCATGMAMGIIVTGKDVTQPTLLSPAKAKVSCGVDISPAHLGNATATDDCDPAVTITFIDLIQPGSCLNDYTIVRTWRATDASGNLSTSVQSITVQDITPPLLSDLPPDMTVDCNAVPDPTPPVATDNCTAIPEIQYTEYNTVTDCSGTIVRTWSATDECGNVSSASQVITVIPATGTGMGNDSGNIRVYPNPNRGAFHFECSQAGPDGVRLEVLDIAGRIVMGKTYPAGHDISDEIRMPDGSEGVFFLRLITTAAVTYRKIIVK